MQKTLKERLEEAREFALEHPRLAGDALVNAIVWWDAERPSGGDWILEIFREHERRVAAPLECFVPLSDPRDSRLPDDELRNAAWKTIEALTGHVPHIIVLREQEVEAAPRPGGCPD